MNIFKGKYLDLPEIIEQANNILLNRIEDLKRDFLWLHAKASLSLFII